LSHAANPPADCVFNLAALRPADPITRQRARRERRHPKASKSGGASPLDETATLDSFPPLRDNPAQAMWSADMDVGEWLRGLGLGEYEGKFRHNRIDAEVLPHLTADDLKDIGVSAVGDRRKLIAAIAALAGAAPPAAVPSASRQSKPSNRARDLAERRPITVMFCDLVGSTSLAAKLDAEDWRNLVNAYLDEASNAVTGLGGHVLKRLGDGLMALFGYPHAQENDAERAVRAALAIQRAISEINARNAQFGAPELAARIGIECGPVIVDSAGEVFGEAPNVAARVQAATEPATVLVTSTVQREVSGLFVVEDKGAHELKGVSAPMRLYRILRVSGGRRRKGARVLTPFVGREEDFKVLARRWERVRAGEGQFVLIVGEPGIGKSRLVEEFRARVVGGIPHSWIEWTSSQFLQNTPLHPITEWGRVRFGGAEVPAERRFAELEAVLAEIKLDPAEYAPLVAPLVDIPVLPDRLPDLPPDEVHRRQLAAMVDWALAGARVQPLVLVFEDLQWFDPSSIDLIHALSDRGSDAPLLILATARPEFRAPWSLRSHHSVISLTPLDPAQVQCMVAEIASRHALSADMIKGLSERAGGVPLFVEEVTRLLLERGEHGGVQAIPPTLRQSLAARLDRLGATREVAQVGAVLGRSFSYGLLRDVASHIPINYGNADLGETSYQELDEAALQSSLDSLIGADLLFVEGVPPEATYRFKHALIRDAAYDGLLKSRRQVLHRRAAEALIEANAEPEAVAHHLTEAGLEHLAIEWWTKAGDNALRRSAFKEAIAHLGRAIAISDRGGGVSKWDAGDAAVSTQLVKLHTDYAQALTWLKGFAADETSAAYARVGKLASQTGDSLERNVFHHAKWIASFIRGDFNLAREQVEIFLREAEASGRAMDMVAGHRSLGLTCLFQGDFALARFHLERALVDHVPERDVDARRLFGTDTGVTAKAFLALLAWLMGEPDHARRLMNEAIREGNDTQHVATIATNHLFLTRLEVSRDDPTAALPAAQALLAFSEAHDIALYAIYGEIFSSWASGRLTDQEAGASQLRRAVAGFLALGNKNAAPTFYGLIADLEAKRGDADSALASIQLAMGIAQENGEHWTDCVLFQRKAEILLYRDPGNPTPAEEALQTAIAVSRRQEARGLGLQAALALAKLYRSNSRATEAQAVLEPALEGFAATPEMAEIAEAQVLLATVAQ
jgi:class 3 adenylate cyclase/tetratricopeptide (TPR) repeat protein